MIGPFGCNRHPHRLRTVASQQAFVQGPLHNIFHGRGTTLVGLVTGACAESYLDPTTDMEERVVQQIQTMYQVSDRPVQFVAKRWAAEEFSRGCFAGVFPPNGSFSTLGPLLRTREGPCHWASTETSPCWYGYVEGAILAGQRAADDVLSSVGGRTT
jgi:monoamine oxidase